MSTLKLGLTISGAVSLGAYEAGALAALVTAARASDGEIAIDAISGASAGAMTAVLTAWCVTNPGQDVYDTMWLAWVTDPSLANLRSRDDDAPLSVDSIRDHWHQVLTASAGQPGDGTRVKLSLAVVSLGGLGFRVVVGGQRGTIDSTTHLDWSNHDLSSDKPAEDWTRALDAAVASGANAAGFAPCRFTHSATEQQQMEQDGLQNPSPEGAWYTDGGTIDNEPFGRLLDMIADLDQATDDDPRATGDNRLVLLIHPTSDTLPTTSRWTDTAVRPPWLFTAWAALRIQSEQSLSVDLQRLAKTNSRVRWLDELATNLADTVATFDQGSQDAVRAALVASIGWLDAQHQHVATSSQARPTGATEPASADLKNLIEIAFGRATGLAEKRDIQIDVVSPAIADPNVPSDELTAGDKIGHFFGFADERFRASDFRLGWENMRAWLAQHLESRGVSDVVAVVAAVDALAAAKNLERHPLMGGASWGDLTVGDVWELGRVATHTTGVVVHDLAHRDGTRVPLDPSVP